MRWYSEKQVVHDDMEKMVRASSFSKLSYGFQLEEEGRWAGLFHTRVVVRERSCAMTIDHMNLINAASIEMVEKLALPKTPRPQSYLFRWGHAELTVTHQTKVPFMLGNYFCEVLCDVIPVSMISCHLLLGKPWYKEHDVAYDCQTHKYTIKKCKKCDLVPMGEGRFIAWRKEHQDKIKEQEEAKKKMVEAAEIFVVTVQSEDGNIAEKDDPKPRTVLIQGGEDDTNMSDAEDVVGSKRRNIYTPNYFQLSEDDETAKALAVEHVDLFLEEKERREHFLQPLNHAYPSKKAVRIDEYTWDSSWRDRVSVHWFERKKVQLGFLFIFLPCKEKYGHAASGSNNM